MRKRNKGFVVLFVVLCALIVALAVCSLRIMHPRIDREDVYVQQQAHLAGQATSAHRFTEA